MKAIDSVALAVAAAALAALAQPLPWIEVGTGGN